MDTLPRPSSPLINSSFAFEEDEEVVMTSPNGLIPANDNPESDEDELWEQLQTQYGSPTSHSPPEIIQTASPDSPHTLTENPVPHDTATHGLGSLPSKLASGDILTLQNGIAPTNTIWSNQDLSLLRIYKACDDAGAPRYLPDKLLTLLRGEIQQNAFNPTHPSITRRDPFMDRMHRKFPTTPPTRFDVILEDGTTLPIFWFDFLSSLRHHLLCEDLYGDLENLNVNQEDQWLPYQNTSGKLMKLRPTPSLTSSFP
jgi:hypothetical protein